MRSYTLSLILFGAAALAAASSHAADRAPPTAASALIAKESVFAASTPATKSGTDNVVSAMLTGATVLGETPRKFGPATPMAYVPPAVSASRIDAMLDNDGPRPYEPLLTGVVGLMLIAYQLRRKHRVLRPRPFAL